MKKVNDEHDGRVIQLAEQERTRVAIERQIHPLNTEQLYPPLEHAMAQTAEASARVARHLHDHQKAVGGE